MTATQEQLAKLATLVNAPGLWEYPALDTPAGVPEICEIFGKGE